MLNSVSIKRLCTYAVTQPRIIPRNTPISRIWIPRTIACPVPLKAAGSAKIPRRSINLFMALINTRNASMAVNPASAFFFFASPTAIPAQKISPRLFKIATRAPDKMVPKPFVTGLSRNGRISISLAFVNTFPTAMRRPAIGRISTGMNIALENACIMLITFSFISYLSVFLTLTPRGR